jgi:hypothetical protein
MIWSKQYFHFDVARWLDGDQFPPPQGAKVDATGAGAT